MDNIFAMKTATNPFCSHGLDRPSTIKKQLAHHANGLDPLAELENVLHDKLQVKDENLETSSDSPSDEDDNSTPEEENTSNDDLNMDDTSIIRNSSNKCVTFPVSDGSEGDEAESHLENCKARKLVSAMKGTREKEGIPQKKLSVSWAPDVYDPPPTSVSHYPKKKNYQQYSKSYKKHGKSKQKSKNVRGGSSSPKEKKHHRKTGGKSYRNLHSYAVTDRLDIHKSSMDLLDFNDPGIGSPDPNCGSKFLGQARGTTHCVY